MRPELGYCRRRARLLKAAGELSPTIREQRLLGAQEVAFETLIESYQVKYEKAAECLNKDRDLLLTFYDFPAERWKHLPTANPIESTSATVRHRRLYRRAVCRTARSSP